MKYIYAILDSLSFLLKRRKVNFIIAGVQKSGTTALDSYLRENPQICLAKTKEVHFFDRDIFFIGIPNYLAYYAYFSPNKKQSLIGEATPIYSYWDTCPKRMWEYNPELKLILVLRNPIERAYSHWNMERQRGNEPLTFKEAIKSENKRAIDALPEKNRAFSYIDRGFYSCQIRNLWKYFPKEQILFIQQDSLFNNPNELIRRVSKFLGVESHSVTKREVHSRSYKDKMTQEEKKILVNIYQYEILQLQELLGWDCSDWTNKH